MKIKHIALAMLFVAIVISGCDKIEEVLDITFDTTFKTDLNIDVPADTKAGIDGTFAVSETINPTADETVEQYIDHIKSFEVTELSGEIISISKNVNLVGLNVSILSATNAASWTFQNFPISLGTVITFDNNNGQWDAVDSILGEKKVFTVSAVGETDEDDVSFVIEITIKTRVTASPL